MKRAVSKAPNTLVGAHKGLMHTAQKVISIQPHISPIPNALSVHIKPKNDVWNLTLDKDQITI